MVVVQFGERTFHLSAGALNSCAYFTRRVPGRNKHYHMAQTMDTNIQQEGVGDVEVIA